MQSCKRSPQSVLSALWIYQRAIFSHMKKEGGSAGYPPVYTKKGNRTGKVGEFIKKHVFSDLRNLFIFFSIFFLLVLPSEDGTASTTYVCIQKSQNQRKVKFMTFFLLCPLLLPKYIWSRHRQTFSTLDSANSSEQIFTIQLSFLHFSCEHKNLTRVLTNREFP